MKFFCQPKVDRVQFTGWRKRGLPDFPGFEVKADYFVRQQAKIRTYLRVRTYENSTGTRLFLQYRPACPWLADFKITVVGDDRRGLCRSELERIVAPLQRVRFVTVEIAFDFPASSGLDRSFVLCHGRFGRSRRVRGWPATKLQFGTRPSSTLTRAYKKHELRCYRIEIELHSRWFRQHRIETLADWAQLSNLLSPSRIEFVRVDWRALSNHLRRKGHAVNSIVREAQSRSASLQSLMHFLRAEFGITNVHRFLIPLRCNRRLRRALRVWANRWRSITSREEQ